MKEQAQGRREGELDNSNTSLSSMFPALPVEGLEIIIVSFSMYSSGPFYHHNIV